MRIVRIIKQFLLILTIIPIVVLAIAPSGDGDYFILEEKEENYRLIFSQQYLNSIKSINQKIKNQIISMSKFKKRKLDETLNIILLSDQLQFSNAFATVNPFYTIGIFPTGIISITDLSEPFWLDGAFTHELNHIFQLSHSNWPPLLKKIINLPSALMVFYFKQFTPYPNMMTPRFILEGDAILKESLERKGGRLYDGSVRAFVYSQIRHYQHDIDKFTKQKLLRINLTSPHVGREAYQHGGYLMAMLAHYYSQDSIHNFFKVSKKKPSKKDIKNFQKEEMGKIFSSPKFEKIFSFKNTAFFASSLVKSYFNYYLSEASQQKYSTTPPLFKSNACAPFNQEGDDIFFLTSNWRNAPTVRVFNTKNKKWTEKKIDIPFGKLFKINDQYYSRSSQRVAPYTIHYSLFSKGFKSHKDFDSKYVTDIKGDKVLSIDTTNNLNHFKLYLNDKFYANVNSNALFDHRKNIYYFKQKGTRRILYRNKSALFSYKGFYGSLLEIGKKGVISFIGASPYGSSVYRFKGGQISRVVSSDTVVQAKKINNKEFLVCEITPYEYEFKIVSQNITNDKPVLYKYNFKKNKFAENKISEKQSERNLASKKENKISKNIKTAKTKQLDYKIYSSFKNFRYGGTSFIGMTIGLNSALITSSVFSDYLQYNTLQILFVSAWIYPYIESPFQEKSLYTIYRNKKYYLNYSLHYLYDSVSIFSDKYKEQTIGSILNYPLVSKGRWYSYMTTMHSVHIPGSNEDDVSSNVSSKVLNPNQDTLFRRTTKYNNVGVLNIKYSQKFPFNYFLSNKSSELQLFVDHLYLDTHKKYGIKSGIIGNSILRLWGDFYWLPTISYTTSFHPLINPVEAYLYSKSIPKNLDQKDQSLYVDIGTDDTTSKSFINFDFFQNFFQNRYLAKSVGTISMGFKQQFLGPSYVIAAGFRSRWIALENLMYQDNLFRFSTQTTSNNAVLDGTQQLVKKNPSKKLLQSSQYTYWLEWMFGIEYLQLLERGAGIIMGFSYGFRTPVKFWEKDDSASMRKVDEIEIAEAEPEQELNTKIERRDKWQRHFLKDMAIQFYVKKPF